MKLKVRSVEGDEIDDGIRVPGCHRGTVRVPYRWSSKRRKGPLRSCGDVIPNARMAMAGTPYPHLYNEGCGAQPVLPNQWRLRDFTPGTTGHSSCQQVAGYATMPTSIRPALNRSGGERCRRHSCWPLPLAAVRCLGPSSYGLEVNASGEKRQVRAP